MLKKFFRYTHAQIDLQAISQNFDLLKKISGDVSVISVVKCNAYGHGIQNVLSALTNSDKYAVSSIDEAIEIKDLVDKPIVILQGVFSLDELDLANKYNFEIVLHCEEQLNLVLSYERKIKLWIKFNIGMNRLGFCHSKAENILFLLKSCFNIELIGLITHFRSKKYINIFEQNKFKQISALKKGLKISARSSSSILLSSVDDDYIRPGISLYGVSPFYNDFKTSILLKPAMTLVSKIIVIRECKKGEYIGYSPSYILDKNTRIGIISIGYGDGYPGDAPVGTPVLIRNKKVPIVGQVCMDMLMVNLEGFNEVQVGDEVVLWGKNNRLENLCKNYFKRIPNEVLCGVSKRVPRVVVKINGEQ